MATLSADLSERLQRLEAVQAIQDLKARYADYADMKYDADHRRLPPDRLAQAAALQASCFTDDAVWVGGDHFGGDLRGREALARLFVEAPWSFAFHLYASPVIEVAPGARSATGSWRLWQAATVEESQRAVFLAARTEEAYRREQEGWLISRMKFEILFITPFDSAGWSAVRNLFRSASSQ